METLKADDYKRVTIPAATPRQVFDYTVNSDGSILLTPLKKSQSAAAKVKFYVKRGHTIGHAKGKITTAQVKSLLSEFP